MVIKRKPGGKFILLFFLLISCIFASWGTWYYGGCHGSRPFVDFYPLLALPLGFMLDHLYDLKKWFWKTAVTLVIILFSFYNLKLIYNFQVFTGSTWGWHDYLQTLDRAGLYNLERSSYAFKNDFENITIDNGIPTTTERCRSGSRATYMMESMTRNSEYSKRVNDIIRHRIIKKVDLSVWFNPRFSDRTGAMLVFQISDSTGKPVFSKMIPADGQGTMKGRWTKIRGTFEVPAGIDPADVFSFYVWNASRKRFYIDDLELRFN